MPDSLQRSEELFVDVNIFKDENKHRTKALEQLPVSCSESADALENDRAFFEKKNIFPKGTIDRIINQLKSFDDKNLSDRLYGKEDEIRKLVTEYMHHM